MVQLDAASIWWVSLTVLWTAIVAAGMILFWSKRRLPLLRIRGIALSFSAIICLHIYWMTVQLLYVAAQVAPESLLHIQEAQFWIMGTYLPLGMALFHASNTRFLIIAKAQTKFAWKTTDFGKPPCTNLNGNGKTIRGRLQQMDHTKMVLLLIGIGMSVQVFLTFLMYLMSRKFHPGFGIPGTEVHGTLAQEAQQQGRGWEWWPSILWQLCWSWIIAPITLLRARRIHDTLGWRTQTIACCLASLPATPLWLVALYVPGMASVNAQFIAPQWIATSIMAIEIFSIFFPYWQALKHQALRQETLCSIAAWEAKTTGTSNSSSQGYQSSILSKFTESISGDKDQLLTMRALQYVLDRNPDPLRKFSALRDFSGENVAFLTSVAEWKSSYQPPPHASSADSPEDAALRRRFMRAVQIYHDFISPRHADFPINISCRDVKKMHVIFGEAMTAIFGNTSETNSLSNPAAPFEPAGAETPSATCSRQSQGSLSSGRPIVVLKGDVSPQVELESMGDNVTYLGKVPGTFNAGVFDDAENQVKYLVLHNTWPKFVSETGRHGSETSSEG